MSTTGEGILKEALRATLGDASNAASLLDGSAWRDLTGVIGAATGRIRGESSEEIASGYRYLARFLSAGLRSCLTYDDPDYPALNRMIDDCSPWGLDHPDCLYLYGALRPDRNYTLSGRIGDARVFDIQVNAGHFSSGEVEAVDTLSAINREQLEVEQDGTFELRIGPALVGSNCLDSAPNGRFLQIRQYFADWERERPAELILECDEAAWPAAPIEPRLIGRQLETLTQWIDRGGALWESLNDRFLAMPENSAVIYPARESRHGALAGQIYGMGHFRCSEGEAVIVTLTLPECKHWNISLANRYWEAIDYAKRQSSLNSHQASKDDDGKICFVIAQEEPGHPNWLDPGGNERGTLALRLHQAAGDPSVEFERVPWTELQDRLGGSHRRVEPDERRETIRRRWHGVRKRFRS